MAIVNHPDWDLSERGKKDAERHHKKIDEAIRKQVKDVIADESIITNKKGKIVRVPVKGLKDYRFVYGRSKKGQGKGQGEGDGEGSGGQGVGQGPGKPGDVIYRKSKEAGKDGPGDKPGEDYIEAEVDIDYLINVMFQDLGLPWIEEKIKASQLVPSGWKFETVSKVGILPRVHKKRTMVESIKRSESYILEIISETQCSYDDAIKALTQAKGDLSEAIDIINNGLLDQSIEAHIIIEDDDLRYKQIEQDYELHSNAVVIAMMDVSGSMDKDKKYLCRSLLFWLVEFLKKVYDHVEIRFIVHTTEAALVDENTFFHKGESGGTYCWSAIEKAVYLMDTEYPIDQWNVYCMYVSDGEDFEPAKSVRYIAELLKRKPNMFSYTEVSPSAESPAYGTYWSTNNTLIQAIKDKWTFKSTQESGAEFCKNEELHFLLAVIRDKSHVYPTLKHILFKET